ncbi:MAG: AAA-like domain-containing protein [Elainellaceae cyanobacterium]
MPRSLRVHKSHIDDVKLAVPRHGYPRQKDLAEALNLSLTTVSNFLNGKPVDYLNFIEICAQLDLEWGDIASFHNDDDLTPFVPDASEFHPDSHASYEEDLNHLIYIERPPIEHSCSEALLQAGALVRIKAPSLMGKSALLAHILPHLKDRGFQVASVNFHLAEATDFDTLDAFLRWFCITVGQRLRQPNRLADVWDERFSTAKTNCTQYFEEYLLPTVGSPVVLCLDAVDRIFPYPKVAAEFLGLLRAWHEQAKISPIWRHLRLVVMHSTEIYLQLNINESPFNVGLAIELPEFTLEQVNELADRHELTLNTSQIQQLFDLVGGHPYLVQQAFSYLKDRGEDSYDALLQTAATEAGIYRDHLRKHWSVFRKHPERIETLKMLVHSDGPIRLKPSQTYQLYSRGLVRLRGNDVMIRCHLYREYFADQLTA